MTSRQTPYFRSKLKGFVSVQQHLHSDSTTKTRPSIGGPAMEAFPDLFLTLRWQAESRNYGCSSFKPLANITSSDRGWESFQIGTREVDSASLLIAIRGPTDQRNAFGTILKPPPAVFNRANRSESRQRSPEIQISVEGARLQNLKNRPYTNAKKHACLHRFRRFHFAQPRYK